MVLIATPVFSYGVTENSEQVYLSERLSSLEEYIRFIHEKFKDDVDLNVLIDGAFRGVVDSLKDPYSTFFGPTIPRPEAQRRVVGEIVGIGVQMETIVGGRLAGQTMVHEVIEGSPAERAGILPGDIIIKVDGADVRQTPGAEIATMLRGEEGTTVVVTVDRGRLGEHTYTIIRQRIAVTDSFFKIMEDDIGYINLASFGIGSHNAFANAMDALIEAGATSLILDIRDNPGGVIIGAVEIAEELIGNGVIVHMEERGEIVESIEATNGQGASMPVVLLINENTASAGEILAAALQDNDAAILVGETTLGKGTAQTEQRLGGGRYLTLSVFNFLTPNMEIIEDVGITPDYEVANTYGLRREDAARRYEAFAPFAEETRPVYGEAGLNVLAAQQRLRLLGHDIGLTAIMDYQTVRTISEFQRARGLWAGGVLDFTTQRHIQEATLAYINNTSTEDLQLLKAIELVRR